jgi:hypothetical protein
LLTEGYKLPIVGDQQRTEMNIQLCCTEKKVEEARLTEFAGSESDKFGSSPSQLKRDVVVR